MILTTVLLLLIKLKLLLVFEIKQRKITQLHILLNKIKNKI